jgi:hypothetical protein
VNLRSRDLDGRYVAYWDELLAALSGAAEAVAR